MCTQCYLKCHLILCIQLKVDANGFSLTYELIDYTAQQQFVTKLKTSFFKDFLTLKTMEAFILACKIHEAVKIA